MSFFFRVRGALLERAKSKWSGLLQLGSLLGKQRRDLGGTFKKRNTVKMVVVVVVAGGVVRASVLAPFGPHPPPLASRPKQTHGAEAGPNPTTHFRWHHRLSPWLDERHVTRTYHFGMQRASHDGGWREQKAASISQLLQQAAAATDTNSDRCCRKIRSAPPVAKCTAPL